VPGVPFEFGEKITVVRGDMSILVTPGQEKLKFVKVDPVHPSGNPEVVGDGITSGIT